MKRFLPTFLVALLVASVAWAGWNIQQKDDGTTDWINPDSETLAAGDTGLVIRIADVTAADTQYIVIPRAGFVRRVYMVTDSAYATNSDSTGITFHLETDTHNAFDQITGNVPSTSGVFSPATDSSPAVQESYVFGTHTITTQGQVLAIVTDGTGDNGGEVWLTIIID